MDDLGRGRDLRRWRGQAAADLEARPAEIRVRHLDRALVQLDELVRDGKPEARSRGLPIGAAVTLSEPFEDRLAQLGLHAWTGIVDGHGQPVAPDGNIHAHRRPPAART